MSVDIGVLVREKSGELLARPHAEAWAACACIWVRVYVLSAPGWARHSKFHAAVCDSLLLALRRAGGGGLLSPDSAPLETLKDFDVEDDGSTEWNYMVDLMEMISAAADDQDVAACTETAIRVYLEGVFNLRARGFAVTDGKSISYADAKIRIANDVEWIRSVDFVRSLLQYLCSI